MFKYTFFCASLTELSQMMEHFSLIKKHHFNTCQTVEHTALMLQGDGKMIKLHLIGTIISYLSLQPHCHPMTRVGNNPALMLFNHFCVFVINELLNVLSSFISSSRMHTMLLISLIDCVVGLCEN